MRELIEADGVELRFLPPCNSDANPIEMVFSESKHLLRALACDTGETLWRSIRLVVDAITPSDAANCFRHRGYAPRDG